MEYKNIFEIEFIQRTQEIVNGYQIPFENTLFINACVGLLIIPQQSLFNHLPTEVVSADKWGIADTDISCIKEPNKSVKNVARHIRNAIAHDGIRFGSDNGKDINGLSDFYVLSSVSIIKNTEYEIRRKHFENLSRTCYEL